MRDRAFPSASTGVQDGAPWFESPASAAPCPCVFFDFENVAEYFEFEQITSQLSYIFLEKRRKRSIAL